MISDVLMIAIRNCGDDIVQVAEINDNLKKKGYKVVTAIGSDLLSFIHDKPHSIKYKINEWVMPKEGNGSLCVFSSIDDALDFFRSEVLIFNPGLITITKIFTCYYIPSDKPVFCKEYPHFVWTPEGTVKAAAVKLLDEVDYSEII
jgi:hypothetical protein